MSWADLALASMTTPSAHLAELRSLVEELELEANGYNVELLEGPMGHLTVQLGHPLLLSNEWSVTADPGRPEWQVWVREQLLGWPDLSLTRGMPVRPEALPILAALRNGATQGRLTNPDSEVDPALWAIYSAALALVGGGVLTRQEADWLERALESDQEWLRR